MEKFLQTLPNVLWEAKSFPGENHWSVQEYNIEKQKYLQTWESSPDYNSISVKILSKDFTKNMCNVFMILAVGGYLLESGI